MAEIYEIWNNGTEYNSIWHEGYEYIEAWTLINGVKTLVWAKVGSSGEIDWDSDWIEIRSNIFPLNFIGFDGNSFYGFKSNNDSTSIFISKNSINDWKLIKSLDNFVLNNIVYFKNKYITIGYTSENLSGTTTYNYQVLYSSDLINWKPCLINNYIQYFSLYIFNDSIYIATRDGSWNYYILYSEDGVEWNIYTNINYYPSFFDNNSILYWSYQDLKDGRIYYKNKTDGLIYSHSNIILANSKYQKIFFNNRIYVATEDGYVYELGTDFYIYRTLKIEVPDYSYSPQLVIGNNNLLYTVAKTTTNEGDIRYSYLFDGSEFKFFGIIKHPSGGIVTTFGNNTFVNGAGFYKQLIESNYEYYVISWNKPLAYKNCGYDNYILNESAMVFGQYETAYIGDSDDISHFCDYNGYGKEGIYQGNKRIKYTKPDGSIGYANPYIADSINIKKDSVLQFQMYASYSNSYLYAMSSNNYAHMTGGRLMTASYTPSNSMFLKVKTDNCRPLSAASDGHYFWFIDIDGQEWENGIPGLYDAGNNLIVRWEDFNYPMDGYGFNKINSDGRTENGKCKKIILPDTIDTIPMYAFRRLHYIQEIIIPKSVTRIGTQAFEGCGNLDLFIPDSVKEIYNNAFLNILHIEYHGTATGAPWGALSMN